MNKSLFLFILLMSCAQATDHQLSDSLHEINNFHFVSEQLASSGMLDLKQYDHIKAYGFKHVINLIPGNQIKERKHVQSLGLSYQQIPVDWGHPKAADFAEFVELMQAYGDDKVYVHCEMNMRASAFVYLYRVLHLGVNKAEAEKDLLRIWQPQGTWQQFIQQTLEPAS